MARRIWAKKSFGAELIEDIETVLAHRRGLVQLEQVCPKPIDVKTIRGPRILCKLASGIGRDKKAR